jgi:hypothetical protein
MPRQSVSLTIALEWDNLTPADHGRMDKVRTMLTTTVDTYGREADTRTKVWIVQGTTNHRFISFAQHLASIFPIDAVRHFAVSVQPS